MVAEVPETDDVCSESRQNRKRPTPTSSKAVPYPSKGSGGDPQAMWPRPNGFPSLNFSFVKAKHWIRSLRLFSDIQPPMVDKGFPCGSDGKASVCNAGDPGSIPGFGRSPGEGNGSPLHYPCLENPMDRGVW